MQKNLLTKKEVTGETVTSRIPYIHIPFGKTFKKRYNTSMLNDFINFDSFV